VLLTESAIVGLFLVVSFLGFKVSLWFIVAALGGHGVFNFVHASVVSNPGLPAWWPSFCLAYDIVAAGFLATLLKRFTLTAAPHDKGLELMIPPPLVRASVADLTHVHQVVQTPAARTAPGVIIFMLPAWASFWRNRR
jgi:hypothetical protein